MDTNLAIPTGMDAGAVNLARAIRNRESGTSTDSYLMGDKDTSSGRYQWSNGSTTPLTKGQIPKNFQDDAKQYGLDPTDFSAKNQDMVAYNKILDLKKKGKNVIQIAALWNGGDENRYDPNYVTPSGLKSQGDGPAGHYDVPAYVKSVNDYYQSLKAKSGDITDNPTPLPPNPLSSPEVNQQIQQMQSQGKSQEEIQAYIESVKNGTTTPITPMTPPTTYGQEVGQQFTEGGQKIVSSIEEGANLLNEGGAQNSQPGVMNKIEGGLKMVEGLTGSFLGTFGGALQTVLSPVSPLINRMISTYMDEHPELKTAVSTIAKPLDGFAQKNPQEAKVIGDGVNALLAALGEKMGAKKVKTEGFDVKNPFSSKAAEDLAKVPESEVSKLSANEQKEWYRQQSKTLAQQATEATSKAQEAGQKSLEETKTQINDFNKQIAETSRTETTALKPKAQQLMKTSSQEYVSLTGEAVDGSPALSKTISGGDLSSKIDTKFEYDPEIGTAIKQDLGLTGAEGEKLTNQQILDKARGIMQDVSKSARAGNTVYSPEEYAAMKKYSFLMETLGENGVDMTKANAFWKQWVPVRNRIVREIKPWDTETVGKQPFEGTIKKAAVTTGTPTQMASKLDAQNFISELETRMKVPKGTIGSDTRQLVEGLEKAKLSKDSIAQITKDALAKIKEDKVAALEKMSLAKYDTLKVARIRLIIKRVIQGAITIGVLKNLPVVGNVIKTAESLTGL